MIKSIFIASLYCIFLLLGRTTLNAQTVLSVEGGSTGTWTAPTTGGPYFVRITAKGGDGGRGASDIVLDVAGGQGATLSGIFKVEAGQTIRAISGAKGSDGTEDFGGEGGGGAGAVNASTTTLLLLAGGGNGGNAGVSGSGALVSPGNGNGGASCSDGGGGGGINGPGEGVGGGGQVSLSGVSAGGGGGGSGMGGGGAISYALARYDRAGGGGQTGGGCGNAPAYSLPGGSCQSNTAGGNTASPQDGYVKVELLSTITYYKDGDSDGFGDPAQGQPGAVGCAPEGYVTDNNDYNDNDPAVHLPTLTCPGDVTVANDAGKCGAKVTYAAPTAASGNAKTINDTFYFSGSIVQWTVPKGVTKLTITAKGAAGASPSGGAAGGLGASIKGDFNVTQGTVLKILSGGTPANSDGKNHSGGGGSFVTDAANAALVIAGGGGGGGSLDAASKQGQAGEAGGNGSAYLFGAGGTGGNGGQAGYVVGGGGGLSTDGGSSVAYPGAGGKAFVNGGTAGDNSGVKAGFGGGGFGFDGYGGGGGGYSGGGGSGQDGSGGGGGSYNAGTAQANQSGVQGGNGLVVLSYDLPHDLKVVQTAGLSSGTEFPTGTTTNAFALVLNDTDTLARCSSTVTVTDAEGPVLTCPVAQKLCYSSTGTYSIPQLTASDNCGIQSTSYSITGTTTRSGTGSNASGTFNTGNSTILWTVKDKSGNVSSRTTTVTVNKQIIVSIADIKVLAKGVDANTVYPGYAPAASITLTATASGGSGTFTYRWSTGATTKSITVSPTATITYTITVTDGSTCTAVISKQVKAINVGCGGSKVNVCHGGNSLCIDKSSVADHLNHGDKLGKCGSCAAIMSNTIVNIEPAQSDASTSIYPNPTTGAFVMRLNNTKEATTQVSVLDGKGGIIEQRKIALTHGPQTFSFNLSDKSNGIYLINVQTENGVKTFKVIVQH